MRSVVLAWLAKAPETDNPDTPAPADAHAHSDAEADAYADAYEDAFCRDPALRVIEHVRPHGDV